MLRSELVITVIMIVEKKRMPGIEVWRRGGGVPRRFSQI
jgi:hypothetical protein